MDLARFCELDCRSALSFLCLFSIPACAAGDLLQDVFREHTAAAKFDSLLDQFKQHVLGFLTDCRDLPYIDNECATEKVCIRLFAGSPQLCRPGPNQLALQNQPSLIVAFNDLDLQHGSFL